MPNESLWHWGAGADDHNRALNLLDDHHHWVKAFSRWGDWMALDSDGGLWWLGTKLNLALGTNLSVIGLGGGPGYYLVLQSDGTLLAWDSGPPTPTPTFIPAQTNLSWRAVSAVGWACQGISSDGLLWSWHQQGHNPVGFSLPVQESTDTNWIGVADARYAWTSSGHLWGAPVDHLYSSNAVEGRFALGPITHEIRSDGTLWAIGGFGSPRGWRQVGNRSDWVSVWSSQQTYFGLTADGIVWVWGLDWGLPPIETLEDRIARLREDFHNRIWPSSARPVGAGRTLSQPYQKEPRPLIRFKPTPERAEANQ